MNIVKIKKNNYIAIDNDLINDRNISLEALGLMSYLIAKSNDLITIDDVLNASNDSEETIINALNELIKNNYIEQIKV